MTSIILLDENPIQIQPTFFLAKCSNAVDNGAAGKIGDIGMDTAVASSGVDILGATGNVCLRKGLQRHKSAHAHPILTMVTMPKAGHCQYSRARISRVFESWKKLDRVNFVVLSSDCEVLKQALNSGLSVMQVGLL